MAKISGSDIEHLAKLAKLAIDDKQTSEVRAQLEAILDYVEKLKKVKTAGTKPTSQVSGLTNITRADKPQDYGVSPKELLANVPELKNGYIKVKRVL